VKPQTGAKYSSIRDYSKSDNPYIARKTARGASSIDYHWLLMSKKESLLPVDKGFWCSFKPNWLRNTLVLDE
jgi:hypothetical protein